MPTDFAPGCFTLFSNPIRRGAKAFDIALIVAILLSVTVILLGSIEIYAERYGQLFFYVEWAFTLLFSLELLVRLYCLERPTVYLKSFYGIVDVVAIIPTWLVLLVPGAHGLVIVRILRVLRIFRILRLMEFVGEGRLLLDALKRSLRQILLFFSSILMVVTLFAALMYTIESPEAGFTSIPMSIYWAIVSMTTVGYGDIVPATPPRESHHRHPDADWLLDHRRAHRRVLGPSHSFDS